ncbi:MAG: hypothetical protein LBL00_06905 [Endomicrobium sp.]|nr:hypothetical protein [Endomicrobium sp.]
MNKRPFIKDMNISLKIFCNSDRIRFKTWVKRFTSVLSAYNKTETIILFLIYNKGYSRKGVTAITGLNYYQFNTFIYKFRYTDEFNILTAKNKNYI